MSAETWEKLRGEVNNLLMGGHTASVKNVRTALDAHEADQAKDKKPARSRAVKPKDEAAE